MISAIQHFAAGSKAGILLSVALTFEVLFLSLTGANEFGAAWSTSKGKIARPDGRRGRPAADGFPPRQARHPLPAPIKAGFLAGGLFALLDLITEELLAKAHKGEDRSWATARYFAGFLHMLMLNQAVAGTEETMVPQAEEIPPTAHAGHVLLVEDDDGMRMLISRALRESGYRVTGCRNGAEMWRFLPEGGVDLVLLDVMLPGASGLDLLRALRSKGTLPVIMLSARAEEADRVLGLELGADDYVAKPFGRPELLARVRAVLRRSAVAPTPTATARPETLAFAGWRLDLRGRVLTDPEGASVDLSGAEYDLLLVFLEHPGRVMGRDQILEMSRGRFASSSDRSVDTLVSRLRRKLEPPEGLPHVIKTIRGSGYMLASTVERA